MVVKTTAAGEIRRLIGRLASAREIDRETAVARLSILGTRAVQQLVQALRNTTQPATRTAALRALEAIGDRRALEPALALLDADSCDQSVRLAAVGVLQAQLRGPTAEADRAFEALTSVALDRGRDVRVRLAAIEALDDLPATTRRTLRAYLARDPDPAIRGHVTNDAVSTLSLTTAALNDAAAGRLPDSAEGLRTLVSVHRSSAPLTVLHRLVGAIRAREAADAGDARTAWLVARAAVHQALAARKSRVALYDLRETLAAAGEPLPVGFLAALSEIGDATCLEAIARAFVASKGPRLDWWRRHLAAAYRDIVRREHLTRRHAAVKRVQARWPQVADASLPSRLSRSRARPRTAGRI
jgi:HEAT repeat protein